MAKLKVAVLFGGLSGEHDVSCISAAAVADNLATDKYEVYKIGITKNGRWLLYPGATDGMRNKTWSEFTDNAPAIISPDRTTRGLMVNHGSKLDVIKLDVIFPVLHGYGGEDGTIQGLLELSGIPYVGSGVRASAVCMDKVMANTLFDEAGIPQTKWLCADDSELEQTDILLSKIESKLSYPVFVKPAGGGSSIGASMAQNSQELLVSMKLACTHDETILFENYVDGKEVEVAVLGNKNPVATMPGEIRPCKEFYDYEAKYESGDASKIIIPANISKQQTAEIKECAIMAYKKLGCAGLARVDFFVENGTGKILLNEINTMPGFTPISMYAKLMQASGRNFAGLLDELICFAIERNER